MNVNRHIKKKFRVKRGDVVPFTGWLESTRKDIYVLFKELGYTCGAEVGVFNGINAKNMLLTIPNLQLTLVDPWKKFSRRSTDEAMEQRYQRVKRRVRHWKPTIIRKTSVEGAKDVADDSLDFVYIDGMHDFDHIMVDLITWTPKVRKGGIISGHDFFYGWGENQGVIGAVMAYTQAHGINDWYITGGVTPHKNMVEPPSYFWVKQ